LRKVFFSQIIRITFSPEAFLLTNGASKSIVIKLTDTIFPRVIAMSRAVRGEVAISERRIGSTILNIC
jgi:hypothetical protein